jgi:hypothetical protein
MNDRARYVDRLLVMRNAKFVVGTGSCTTKACFDEKGEPLECCNTCVDSVAILGFEGALIRTPDGESVECERRMDCDPEGSTCPSWLRLGTSRELVGAFCREHTYLAFLYAGE